MRKIASVSVGVAMLVAGSVVAWAMPAAAAPYSRAQTDCVLDWAERQHAPLLQPQRPATALAAPYTYRHYTGTQAYLGASAADGHLYYVGPASGGAAFDAGSIADWLGRAGCATAKQPIAGLIDMQGIAWHNVDGGRPEFTIEHVRKFPGVYGGIVINAAWHLIQPAAGGAPDFSSIDDALAQIRAYNVANPAAPLGVKLRVYAGNSAPEWVRQRSGGSLTVQRNPAGCQAQSCPITIGRYWTPEFIAAWRTLQGLLAARYDREPLLRQVAVTSCAPQTDEPFVPTVDVDSRTSMRAAGYTDAAQQACLLGAVEDYSAWKHTLIDFPFNVFTRAGGGIDPAFSLSVMEHCRALLGTRCVIGNHALSAPLREHDSIIYERIRSLGGTVNFQTQAPQAMGCQWRATIAQGIALGAVAIEVWPDAKYRGMDSLTLANVRELAGFFARPIPVPEVPPMPATCSGYR